MKKLTMCVLIVIMVFTQGCCSIFTSGPQDIYVDSVPQGASVKIGPYDGTTPYKTSIPRGKHYVIAVTHGNQTKTETLHKSIEGVYWANILFFPGLIIDLVTGNMFKYEPTAYEFNFNQ